MDIYTKIARMNNEELVDAYGKTLTAYIAAWRDPEERDKLLKEMVAYKEAIINKMNSAS